MGNVPEGWRPAEPPRERAGASAKGAGSGTKEEAARRTIEAFLESGDLCWARDFSAGEGYRLREAGLEAQRLGAVARALSLPVRVRKRGFEVFLVRS